MWNNNAVTPGVNSSYYYSKNESWGKSEDRLSPVNGLPDNGSSWTNACSMPGLVNESGSASRQYLGLCEGVCHRVRERRQGAVYRIRW